MADDPVRQLELIREIAKRPASYELTPGRCLTGVAFLSPELAREIVRDLIEPLRTADPRHHFYEECSLHLTLKNVSSVRRPRGFGESDARKALGALQQASSQFPPPEFELRPPMLVGGSVWIPALTRSPLCAFNAAADSALREVGLDDDKAYFSTDVRFGNITICRLSTDPNDRFLHMLPGLAENWLRSATVAGGELVSCDILCSPATLQRYGQFRFSEIAD